MQIRYMNATFGTLDQAELTLQPGLNVIYAPNESGKSTWSRFIRGMLYGVNTREKTMLADKNRYAPWSGAAMGGRMDVTAGDDEDYTIQRRTRRANAPMGDFSCTYAGTATPVPGITAQNAGEQLLGITTEVFARSAFISQAALSVDQDAELERRIAALITTGEEETSYSETSERLKKQLNRRRLNRTSGQIPALEREIGELDGALERLEELREQHRRTGQQLEMLRTQQADLQTQQRQWAALDRQETWRQYRQTQAEAERAEARLTALRELAGSLPDDDGLARLESQCAGLVSGAQGVHRAEQSAQIAAASARLAQQEYERHPLFPADEAELRRRMEDIGVPDVPKKWPFWLFAVLAVGALAAAAVTFALHLQPVVWAAAGAAGALSAVMAALHLARCRRAAQVRSRRQQDRATLARQTEEYLPLREASRMAAQQAAGADSLYQAARMRQEENTASLLREMAVYRPVANLDEAAVAVGELRRQRGAVDTAELQLRDQRMRLEWMEQHLPEGEAPDPDVPVRQPAMSRAQLRSALEQTEANLRATQSRLDTLAGQIRSMGDPDDLISRRQQKRELTERLKEEYEAIAMAMDALENANLTLQNRFSPALGARAAEIFAAITGGKYHRVLLGRDFSLAAEAVGDTAQRSVQLLSQGATDQLYLSVRLAICDMVLPRGKAVPLIMDDALITFDDSRLCAALDYLLQESASRQILLFTCQRRESDYLAGRENVNLVEL